jgi:xylulokinase
MSKGYLLGFDVGSSSVKASLVDADSGICIVSSFFPEQEAPIISKKPGWAEQEPESWWGYAKQALGKVLNDSGAKGADIIAIGISYQMHGLVCVDKNLKPLRPSIIWCDSRAVPYGERAEKAIGTEKCLGNLLNLPGNFTASKLAWVKENEPEIYSRIYKIMLPGDYIAMKLSGEAGTTVSGLSEGMLWDFKAKEPARFLMDCFGFSPDILSDIVPTFGIQCRVSRAAANETA